MIINVLHNISGTGLLDIHRQLALLLSVPLLLLRRYPLCRQDAGKGVEAERGGKEGSITYSS